MSDHSHGDSHGGGSHGGGGHQESNPLAVASIALCGGVVLAFLAALVGSAATGQRHQPAGQFEDDTGWAILWAVVAIAAAIGCTKQYDTAAKVIATIVTLVGFVAAYALLT